jgi:hypothetical protein
MTSPGRAGARRGVVLAALVGLFVWGCDGANVFAPVTVGPEITDLSAPVSVDAGEALEIAVRALGLVRVDSIVATVRVGDFEQTQVAQQTGILSDYSASFQFPIPTVISDTLGTVEAFAVDAQHNVGGLSAVTVRAIDLTPPTVSVALRSAQIGLGTQIEVMLAAADNIGLDQVGFQLYDPVGDEVLDEVLVDQEGTDAERSIFYTVPESLPLGQAQVIGIAIDHAEIRSTASPLTVTLTDVELPEVQVLTPEGGAYAPAQEPLFTKVRLNDNDAVDSVRVDGVAYRGDRTLGTDTMVVRFSPVMVRFDPAIADTILQRFLPPAADSSKENAFIRAVAYDRHGNVSRDSVEISLQIDEGAPFVEITEPSHNPDSIKVVGIGDSILVRTFTADYGGPIISGVATLELEGLAFRGDKELGTDYTVQRFLKRTVTFDPPVTDVNGRLVSRYLTATSDTTSETVYIIATAKDAWGNARTDTVPVRVVNDTIAPTIVISQPPAGTSVTAGTSVGVQVSAYEPNGVDQSGVERISIDGVSYRFNAGTGTNDLIHKYDGQTFFFFPSLPQVGQSTTLTPTGDIMPETVWLRVFARDALGNTSADSVSITLTP